MAKQHFYSRVPARMSLFNRMDGYDTFAYSSNIKREFIENDLAKVYSNAPTKSDSELISKGELPPFYSQFVSKETNELVQSAFSYITSDYTGERSSYLVHSLILSDKEKEEHLFSFDNLPFNKASLKTDLKDFNLTSIDTEPYRDYKEINVPAKKAGEIGDIADKYDTGMLKRLIYALLGVSCGKTKALFLSLHGNLKTFSSDSLDFINRITLIFPYHLRSEMSFVTYVPDATKFTSFKIRCIPDNYPPIPTAKGVTIKLDAKDFDGLSDDNVAANGIVVDFFYNLIKNDKIRKDFIEFCDYAVNNNESFRKPSFKNITELVMLFRVLSGYFEEKNVLPNDDRVYDFISIYDKYKDSILDKYRDNSTQCLLRYSESQIAIPKNVFSKISNTYLTETAISKATVMKVCLNLIHTDAMRDKLFNFIKANYAFESKETQKEITDSLARVYYGGFLQSNILNFFSEIFENEPEDCRENILEKLLLTIRTPNIQNSVLEFIKRFYPIFTESEKNKFYKTFYEMLPDGDNLTKALCGIVDTFAEDERKSELTKNIVKVINLAKSDNNDKLISAFVSECGFCESVAIKEILNENSSENSVEAFINAINKKEPIKRIDTICEIFDVLPDLSDNIKDKLYGKMADSFVVTPKNSVFEFVSAYDKLELLINKNDSEFIRKIQNGVLIPAIENTFATAFDFKRFPDGLVQISELAKTRDYLSNCKQYKNVKLYFDIKNAIINGDGSAAFSTAINLSESNCKVGASVILSKELSDIDKTDENLLIFGSIINFLKTGDIVFSESSNDLKERISERLRSNDQSIDFEKVLADADFETAFSVIKAGSICYSSDITDNVKNEIANPDSDIARFIATFINKYDKKGKKYLLLKLQDYDCDVKYKDFILNALNKKSQNGSFISKLFKK